MRRETDFGARTAEHMRSVFLAEVELHPVTLCDISAKARAEHDKDAYQSKSKGIDSSAIVALNTFLNSSYVMVPELSLCAPF